MGEGRRTFAALSVHWVGVTPATDTLRAIGDTVRLLASVTDSRGTALVGAWLEWESKDTAIAVVDSTGVVVARAPGSTLIGVRAGEKLATSRIVVAPRVASIALDSVAPIPEGASRKVNAAGLDRRGHLVPGRRLRWSSSDSSIVRVDSTGQVRALGSGDANVVVQLDSLVARTAVRVIPVPFRIVPVEGDSQVAMTGEMLARRVEQVLPGVCDTRGEPHYWTGLRPATPTNIPFIGRTRVGKLWVNAGHGTLGWTHGAGSGKAIAALISGDQQPIAGFGFCGMH